MPSETNKQLQDIARRDAERAMHAGDKEEQKARDGKSLLQQGEDQIEGRNPGGRNFRPSKVLK